MPTISLSEIEANIQDFNAAALTLKAKREELAEKIATAGLGRRFAQKALASVTVKMPEK